MTTPSGGDAIPVAVSTDAPKGLSAVPAIGYTLATLPAGLEVEGGDASPVYLVSAAQIASGAYALAGNVAPVILVAGTGRPTIGDVAPVPVYVVGGSLSPSPSQTFRDVLEANATYAWFGDDLPASGAIASWADAVAGVTATQGTASARPTVGTLGGQRAAVFDGGDQLGSSAFGAAIAQPLAVVCVHQRTGALSADQYAHDGITMTNRAALLHRPTNSQVLMFAGGSVVGANNTSNTSPMVVRAVFNGASSELYLNGALVAGPANAGTQTLTGITIGGRNDNGAVRLVGAIATLAIVAGDDYATRAAAIETAARTFYGI